MLFLTRNDLNHFPGSIHLLTRKVAECYDFLGHFYYWDSMPHIFSSCFYFPPFLSPFFSFFHLFFLLFLFLSFGSSKIKAKIKKYIFSFSLNSFVILVYFNQINVLYTSYTKGYFPIIIIFRNYFKFPFLIHFI